LHLGVVPIESTAAAGGARGRELDPCLLEPVLDGGVPVSAPAGAPPMLIVVAAIAPESSALPLTVIESPG
jgi:hypothetical protein